MTMTLKHLVLIWLLTLVAAGLTVALFGMFGWPVLPLLLGAALAVRIGLGRHD